MELELCKLQETTLRRFSILGSNFKFDLDTKKTDNSEGETWILSSEISRVAKKEIQQ